MPGRRAAPAFAVRAGEVACFGDFVPLMHAGNGRAGKVSVLAHATRPEDARRALAAQQPALAQAMRPAALRNGATFGCAAVTMDRWDRPGTATLPTPGTASTALR